MISTGISRQATPQQDRPVLRLGHDAQKHDPARLRPSRLLQRRRSGLACTLFVKHAPLSRLHTADVAPPEPPSSSVDNPSQKRRLGGFYLNAAGRNRLRPRKMKMPVQPSTQQAARDRH